MADVTHAIWTESKWSDSSVGWRSATRWRPARTTKRCRHCCSFTGKCCQGLVVADLAPGMRALEVNLTPFSIYPYSSDCSPRRSADDGANRNVLDASAEDHERNNLAVRRIVAKQRELTRSGEPCEGSVRASNNHVESRNFADMIR